MPTQRDVERLQALKEADRRGMLGSVQKSALGELERRFMQFAEPAMTAASAAVAEPVSGFVGLAALPYGSDVASQAIERTQQAMTYQPRTEAGLQGLQALQNVMAPVGEAFEGASSYLGDAAYEATGSPALGAAAYSAPTAALELLGANIARRLPGRKLEFGDIGKRPIAGKQRGAVGGITSKADDVSSFKASTGDANIDSRIKSVEMMSPDEYLEKAFQATDERLGGSFEGWMESNQRTPEDIVRYAEAMKAGDQFDMPWVDFDTGSQDGRNRALAAKAAGLKKIPVGVVPQKTVAQRLAQIQDELKTAKGYRKFKLEEELKRLSDEL